MVQSFLRWLVRSGGEGEGEGGGGGEGEGGEGGEGAAHRTEWCYEGSKEGLSDREAGVINYLQGLSIGPCLSYLLARSLEAEAEPTSPLAALTIDVGGFAIEVVASRGALSRISLVRQSALHLHTTPTERTPTRPDPKP